MVLTFTAGFFSGYILTKFTSGPAEGLQGRIKSIKFRIKDYKVHLHHWLHQLILMLALTFLQIRQTLTLPPWLFQGIIGVNLGAIIQGLGYKDWKKVIWKAD